MAAITLPSAQTHQYSLVRQRNRDEGLLVLPLAGPPGTKPEIVRIHGGVETESVDFDVIKDGGPPIVPAYKPSEDNNQELSGTQAATIPMLKATGQQTFRMVGHYEYVHRAPKGLDSEMPTGMLPMQIGIAADNAIPAECFATGIIAVDAADEEVGKESLLAGLVGKESL